MASENIDKIVEKNENNRSGIISILQDIQSEYNYLPEDVLRYVSQKLNIPLIDLEKQFINLSRQGIPDPDLLLEHLHPNVKGYYKIAEFIAETIMNEHLWSSSDPFSIHPLEFYLENYKIHQLSIDKVEYDLCLRGNYLERLSLFNPEVRQFLFDVCTRAYENAVRIRDEYLKSQGEQW